LLVASLVMGVRQLGGMQSWELHTYDQMMRLRPDRPPDPRLLVVAITEEDMRLQQRTIISDEVIAQLIERVQENRPAVIGLDLYRDIPQPPGQHLLHQQLQADNVIVVKNLGNTGSDQIPPPSGVVVEQVGFNDIVLDADAVVRRNLLYAKSDGKALYSFSLRLAINYLEEKGHLFTVTPNYLELGRIRFYPLTKTTGGYQGVDDRGYQVLLNYRGAKEVARQVTLTQMLRGEVNPEWIQGKLVMIGTTAPSAKDLFLTPYGISAEELPKTPGVIVHAQMVSQILSTVLDGSPLISCWPDPVEGLWILAWSAIGGLLAYRFRHPLWLGIVTSGLTGGLFGGCIAAFFQGLWVPFVPAAIALTAGSLGVIGYRLVHDAFHDALTGLPNRSLFTKQLQWAIQKGLTRPANQSEEPILAVLLVGIDGFKAINDSFGHRLGDELLVGMTQRLEGCIRSRDQLARIGGDEFAVLLPNVRDAEEATHLADQLQRQITQPFKLNGQDVFTTASIGIVLDQADANYLPEEILRDAHTAMQQAKSSGKSRHQVFVTGMRDQVMTRFQLETDLRHAIERQEFELYYQPMIALQTGKIAGFEALVRWHHPQRGFVHPIEFIPIAEETDLIVPMGKWILQEACRQLQQWQSRFPKQPPLLVSVNLSGRQAAQPDLVELVKQVLQETKIDGHSLKLEITESIAMTDVESTIALLLQLKALNLQLSIDDFGTGYSSLSYLHRFPTDTIKVDRTFVSRMGDGSEDDQIVQTIIILGHNLGMEIVAEGVETAQQLARLRELNCEYAQGYFFSKPISRSAAEALLKSDPQW
jgi:diguanylate cyclase (GGDEF)-like protein